VSDLEQAPDGRVAYVATTNRGDGDRRGGEAVLVVDGAIAMRASGANPLALQFANTIRPSFRGPYRRVAWSPDGKGFAIIKPNSPNPGVTVTANGNNTFRFYGIKDNQIYRVTVSL